MATLEQHQAISDEFLEAAEVEVRKGDILQASAKAWGVAEHFVKSVASDQGWERRTHAHVNAAARKLIELTDDVLIDSARWGAANGLHQNFYEAWYGED